MKVGKLKISCLLKLILFNFSGCYGRFRVHYLHRNSSGCYPPGPLACHQRSADELQEFEESVLSGDAPDLVNLTSSEDEALYG